MISGVVVAFQPWSPASATMASWCFSRLKASLASPYLLSRGSRITKPAIGPQSQLLPWMR
jgi:hypothetical protein